MGIWAMAVSSLNCNTWQLLKNTNISFVGSIICAVVAFCVAIIQVLIFVWLLEIPSTSDGVSKFSWSSYLIDVLLFALVGPAIESLVLIWVLLKIRSVRVGDVWKALIVGLLAAVIHLPAKADDRLIGVVVVTFFVFSWYILHRLQFAAPKVVWLESWVSHGIYNGAGVSVALLQQ